MELIIGHLTTIDFKDEDGYGLEKSGNTLSIDVKAYVDSVAQGLHIKTSSKQEH